MLFLTKRISVGDVLKTAKELAPVFAFCELLENSPVPAILLNGNTVCLRTTVEAVDLLFKHPNLGTGVETATNEDLRGSSILALSKNNALLELIRALTPAVLHGRAEKTFASALKDEIRTILRTESQKEGFMRRDGPYTEPGVVLRNWSLEAPENCDCMRLKCASCRVLRWTKTSVMNKAPAALPPILMCQPNCRFARPPVGAKFVAALNPWGWMVDGVMLKDSIW